MSLSPLQLRELQLSIEPHLLRIEKLFKREIRLTLICRLPGNDDADVLLSMDDLNEARKVIDRRINQEPTVKP